MSNLKKIVTVKRIIELVSMIILYGLFEVEGVLKYAVAVMFGTLLFFIARKNKWSAEVLISISIPVIVYVIAGSFSGMLNGSFQMTSLKIFLFWVVPLMLAFSMYTYYGAKMDQILTAQLIASCIIYLSLTLEYMLTRHTRVQSTFGFVFGIYMIYYAYQKRWGRFALSTVFMYLADKRIVFLGVIVAMMIIGIMWVFQNSRRLATVIWGIVIFAVFGYLYLIYSGIMESFCWGANINTNGRVEIYSRMAQEAKFSIGYFGRGLGVVENLLECWNIAKFANLHNDLLKFYIELGFLGLLLFLLSYVIIFLIVGTKIGKSKMSFLLAMSVYSILLFATDNVSIYIMYLLPLYCVYFAVLSSEGEMNKNNYAGKIEE